MEAIPTVCAHHTQDVTGGVVVADTVHDDFLFLLLLDFLLHTVLLVLRYTGGMFIIITRKDFRTFL